MEKEAVAVKKVGEQTVYKLSERLCLDGEEDGPKYVVITGGRIPRWNDLDPPDTPYCWSRIGALDDDMENSAYWGWGSARHHELRTDEEVLNIFGYKLRNGDSVPVEE